MIDSFRLTVGIKGHVPSLTAVKAEAVDQKSIGFVVAVEVRTKPEPDDFDGQAPKNRPADHGQVGDT
jgi:hypothetical protein